MKGRTMNRNEEKPYLERSNQIFDKDYVKAVDMAIQESEVEEGAELMDAREILETLRRRYIG